MRKFLLFIILLVCLIYPVYSHNHNHNHNNNYNPSPETANTKTADWREVQKIFGQKGVQQGDTIKINFPRTDLNVKIKGMSVNPYMALNGYIALSPMHDHTMMMCTMVLLQDEVEPVIEKLIASNIEITGLHNHLSGETPRIMFLHCSAHGDALKLAKDFKNVLSITKTPLTPYTYQKSNINWGNVESILGFKSEKDGDLIIFNIQRADKIYDMDTEIPPLMGLRQTISMQKAGKKAISIGDFVVKAEEVNPVLKVLTNNGIIVTSIHNHMIDEEPRTFCLHYWGYDTPEKLAKGFKAALEKVNIVRNH